MKFLLFLTAVLLAMPSVGLGQPKNDAKLLVGLWRKDTDTNHTVISRRADGTYLEKVYGLYDLNKPPIYYTSSGSWRVLGNRYITVCKKISVEVWYRKQAGRTYRITIRQIEPGKFKYISTDNADEEELRIGDASDAAFEQATVRPPGP